MARCFVEIVQFILCLDIEKYLNLNKKSLHRKPSLLRDSMSFNEILEVENILLLILLIISVLIRGYEQLIKL